MGRSSFSAFSRNNNMLASSVSAFVRGTFSRDASLNSFIWTSLLKTASLNADTALYTVYDLLAGLDAHIFTTTLNNGLVSYWTLNNNVLDSTGTNNGTATALTYAGGKLDTGAVFNGSTSAINATSSSTLNLGAMSCSVWIKIASYAGYYMILTRGPWSGAQLDFRTEITSGFVSVYGSGGQVTSTVAVGTGDWNHVCFTRDASRNVLIYINGVQQGSGTLTSVASLPATITYIGRRDDGYYFNGSMDELGVWNRVLTPAEVLELYNAGGAATHPFIPLGTGQRVGAYSVGGSPRSAASDGTNIWVSSFTNTYLTKIRESDGANLGTYAAGTNTGVAFDGTNIWGVAYAVGAGTLYKVNPATGAVIGTYTGFNGAYGITVAGANVWVTNISNNTVAKVRISDGVVLGTFGVGTSPYQVSFDGTHIWTSNQGTNTVTKLLESSGAVIGTYATGNQPFGSCFDGTHIWTANLGTGTVTKILASTGATVATYTVYTSATDVSFDGTNVWVTSGGGVTKMLASTGAILGYYSTGATPQEVVVTPTNIWVVNQGSGTITKLTR